jgi:hypothetical protein
MFLSHKTWFLKYKMPPKWQKASYFSKKYRNLCTECNRSIGFEENRNLLPKNGQNRKNNDPGLDPGFKKPPSLLI